MQFKLLKLLGTILYGRHIEEQSQQNSICPNCTSTVLFADRNVCIILGQKLTYHRFILISGCFGPKNYIVPHS